MIEDSSLCCPSLTPVMASTVTSEVMSVPELVMNALLPSITHSPSPNSGRARLRVPPGMSVPPPGSVSPNAASRAPEHRSGSHLIRCSSEPYRYSGMAPRQTAASSVMATEESTRPNSSKARQSAKVSPPMPP